MMSRKIRSIIFNGSQMVAKKRCLAVGFRQPEWSLTCFASFFYSPCCDQGTCSLLQRYRANRMILRDIEDVRRVNDRCARRGEKREQKRRQINQKAPTRTKRPQQKQNREPKIKPAVDYHRRSTQYISYRRMSSFGRKTNPSAKDLKISWQTWATEGVGKATGGASRSLVCF